MARKKKRKKNPGAGFGILLVSLLTGLTIGGLVMSQDSK